MDIGTQVIAMQQPNKNLFITDELHNFGGQNSKNKVFQE